PPSPRFPPLPYTTLFRSSVAHPPRKGFVDLPVSDALSGARVAVAVPVALTSRVPVRLLRVLRVLPDGSLFMLAEAEYVPRAGTRSEEHTSELQSRVDLVC